MIYCPQLGRFRLAAMPRYLFGFVLAAKSFARFKELDKREFAEYVLIGTLISMILAIVAAAATQLLITI